MKTLFAAVAIFICPTFAFGDTIGPSTGCAITVCLGETYNSNIIYNLENPPTVDYIIGSARFTDSAGFIGLTDSIHSSALNLSAPIGLISLSAPGRIDEWTAQSSQSASSIWELLLNTNPPYVSEDHSSGFAAAYKESGSSSYAESLAHQIHEQGENGDRDEDDQGDHDHKHSRKVPEPRSLIILGTGLLIGGGMLRKLLA